MADILVINQTAVQNLLRASRPTVLKYTTKGMPIISRSKYDAAAVVAWYVQHKVKLATAKTNNQTEHGKPAKNAEQRLLEARAVKIETDNDIRDGDLLIKTEVEALFLEAATIVTNSMEALGPRLAPILATIEEPAEIQALILIECRSARNIIADKARNRGLEIENED